MTTASIAARRLAAALLLAGTTGVALAQTPAPVKVTGAEISAWFAADQMAVAGISLGNGCHFIVKGPLESRVQTLYCPNTAPFSVTGQARIEGDRLCSRFAYPDGSTLDACQEVFRVGENKYEFRIGGTARNVVYRLVR